MFSLDFQFMIGALPLLTKAMWLTLKISLVSILISVLIGIMGNVLYNFKQPIVTKFVRAYVELSRNTPLLIQLFFLYFGLAKLGIKLSEMTCAVVGLSFLGGSYMIESIRSGFETVSKNQIESAQSLGMSAFQIFRYIQLPLAFSRSLPLIGANAIFILKETSVVGAISILEIMNVTKTMIGMYYKTTESLILLVLAYLLLILPLSYLLSFLERRIRHAEYGS